jgi:hypothetical protein
MSSPIPVQWRERLTSPLTWHYAGFAVLLVATGFLAVRFGLDWSATNSRSSDALATKQVELKALDLETAPLRGLDQRVADSRAQMLGFYAKRIPPSYSAIAARIGELAVKAPVRLTRVQYSQGEAGTDLTMISLDASLSGQYPEIMRFINGVERDQNFFVIRTLGLTGQQGGLVNLRLRVTTWLRPADAEASGLPLTQADDDASAPGNLPSHPVKEGK